MKSVLEQSDSFEDFLKLKKQKSRTKKERNLYNAIKILDENGIDYEIMSNDIHFKVHGKSEIFDYWPTTGKFIGCMSKTDGRGIRKLLEFC